jgi:ubiquinol-cytochrome c reductase cytochrome b subunit
MGKVTTAMYEREDRWVRRAEDDVRGARTSYGVAAQKTARLAGASLDKDQSERLGLAIHWGLGIGASIMGRTPVLGEYLVPLMLGGPTIAGATLSRFFTLHVFVIPGLLIAFVGLHLLMVLRLGINEWPMPGRVVRRETYRAEYEALVARDGVPFFPDAAKRDILFAGIVIAALVTCAAVFGPIGPGGEPDPTIIATEPAPDFFFLWIFAALALLPANLETPLLLTAPVIGIGVLMALPFLSGTGEKSWRRRPVPASSSSL